MKLRELGSVVLAVFLLLAAADGAMMGNETSIAKVLNGLPAVSGLPAGAVGRFQVQGTGSFSPPVTHSGDGCPGGTVSTAFAPDGSSVSVLYDNYVVAAGPSSGRSGAGASCSVSIPVTTPAGECFEGFTVDHRVNDILPDSDSSRVFYHSYAVDGHGTGTRSSTVWGPRNSGSDITGGIGSADFPPLCGASAPISVSTALSLLSGSDDALASVDSSDITHEAYSGASHASGPGLAAVLFGPILAWMAANG